MTSFDVFCQTCGTIRTVSPATREWPRCCGDEMARKEADCKAPAMLRYQGFSVPYTVQPFQLPPEENPPLRLTIRLDKKEGKFVHFSQEALDKSLLDSLYGGYDL